MFSSSFSLSLFLLAIEIDKTPTILHSSCSSCPQFYVIKLKWYIFIIHMYYQFKQSMSSTYNHNKTFLLYIRVYSKQPYLIYTWSHYEGLWNDFNKPSLVGTDVNYINGSEVIDFLIIQMTYAVLTLFILFSYQVRMYLAMFLFSLKFNWRSDVLYFI